MTRTITRPMALVVFLAATMVPALGRAAPAAELRSAPAPVPHHELSLDATPFAGFISYAHQAGQRWQVGLGAGFGLDYSSFSPGLGAAPAGQFIEIVPLAVFVRRQLAHGFQAEAGLRAVIGMMEDGLERDGAPAGFAGGYASLFWGGRIFQVGSRVSVGALSDSRRPSWDLLITPVILRLSTR